MTNFISYDRSNYENEMNNYQMHPLNHSNEQHLINTEHLKQEHLINQQKHLHMQHTHDHLQQQYLQQNQPHHMPGDMVQFIGTPQYRNFSQSGTNQAQSLLESDTNLTLRNHQNT